MHSFPQEVSNRFEYSLMDVGAKPINNMFIIMVLVQRIWIWLVEYWILPKDLGYLP